MPKQKLYHRLKRMLIVLSLLCIVLWGYVEMVNINSRGMTLRQKFLKAIYPMFTGVTRLVSQDIRMLVNENHTEPVEPFYDLSVVLNNGSNLHFSDLKGKKVMLVNTASECGFTPQYTELEKLYEKYKSKLIVIGFPANNFGQQEKGSDEQIASFCKVNYGVTFPLAMKADVVKGESQQKIFQWLTDERKNGWNKEQPSWNFSKYLVDEHGVLIDYFDPAMSPLDKRVEAEIQK